MPPQSGTRKPLTASYTWGQQGLEAQFVTVFQPGQGIFSPGYPLAPPEPERVRLWDFPVGVNTIYTPRSYEPISFDELRALADAHDITRLAIETRKDQIEKLDWTIKPRTTRLPTTDAATRSAKLADFWRQPDGARPFATWLRELLEDVLVLDAPALEPRRNRSGEIIGLDVVDGATIKVLFDETGRRPKPPAPAFEQVIHGRPWKLLTSDELLYLPRNPRPHKAYGFGPVEQIIMTVNIALRRQAMQLQHFTEGSGVPTTGDVAVGFAYNDGAGHSTNITTVPSTGETNAQIAAALSTAFKANATIATIFSRKCPDGIAVSKIVTNAFAGGSTFYFNQFWPEQTTATTTPINSAHTTITVSQGGAMLQPRPKTIRARPSLGRRWLRRSTTTCALPISARCISPRQLASPRKPRSTTRVSISAPRLSMAMPGRRSSKVSTRGSRSAAG